MMGTMAVSITVVEVALSAELEPRMAQVLLAVLALKVGAAIAVVDPSPSLSGLLCQSHS